MTRFERKKHTSAIVMAILMILGLVIFAWFWLVAKVYVENFEVGMKSLDGVWYYTEGLSGFGYAVDSGYGFKQLSYSIGIPETTCDDVSVWFKIVDSGAWQYAGILTRYNPETGSGVIGYLGQMTGAADVALLTLRNFGEGVRFGYAKITPVNTGVWHELRITAEGSVYKLYLDGKEVISGTNTEFTSGRVGVWSYRGNPTVFDDLTVRI